jgi:hypothetical protein
MGEIVIEESNQLWQTLNEIWIAERKPGYVSYSGVTYRVLRPSGNEVKFQLMGGFNELYGTSSAKGLAPK